MKHINSLAAAVFLAAALSSCAKMRVETEEIRPAGTPIRMAVSSEGTQTKALFDAKSFAAKGNVLQIWDVYFNSVVAPQAYIEGTNVVSTGPTVAVWPFKEGDAVSSPDKHYYWTKTGTHRFYGVLVKDNSGSTPLTPTTLWGGRRGSQSGVRRGAQSLHRACHDIDHDFAAVRFRLFQCH